jgi:hypothetical protein
LKKLKHLSINSSIDNKDETFTRKYLYFLKKLKIRWCEKFNENYLFDLNFLNYYEIDDYKSNNENISFENLKEITNLYINIHNYLDIKFIFNNIHLLKNLKHLYVYYEKFEKNDIKEIFLEFIL